MGFIVFFFVGFIGFFMVINMNYIMGFKMVLTVMEQVISDLMMIFVMI